MLDKKENSMNTEQKMRELANKWRSANMEVSDACRDAAEELQILSVKTGILTNENNFLRSLIKEKNIQESMHDPICSVNGWGKGKDE